MIFAIMMLPTMVMVGGLVDYGLAIKTKSQIRATLDAAMLAAMLHYSEDEDVDYQMIIENYIDKNFTQTKKALNGTTIKVSTAVISEEGEMKASIMAKVPTNFLKFVHFDDFEFGVSSGVMVGGSSIEVALVLDNTGSMKGSKIKALKNAAHDLIDIILPEGDDNSNEKIKFAIVPFADYVNIGKDHRDEPGLDIPANYTRTWYEDAHEQCWDEYPDSTEECTPNPKKWGTCYNDGVAYGCWQWNGQTCTGDPGDPVRKCQRASGKKKKQKYKWYGCVGSRAHDLNVRDEEYETGVPGIMYENNWCKKIAPITRLTASRDDILAGLSKMKAKRETYIPGGLMWGWRTLSPVAPFPDGASYEDDAVRKVIVLMTDGSNTKSTWQKWNGMETASQSWKNYYGYRALHNESDVYGHNGSSSNEANSITSEICSNMKEKGFMIYTIGFEIEGESTIETIMKKCAGNGGQYYDADNSTELADAFKEIGKSLLNLRLSH